MALENVEKAVLEEARAEAERLVAEARDRLAERLALEKRDVEKRFAEHRRHEMNRLDSEHHRELSRARTAARLEVLCEKNRMVEAAFGRALEMLAGLPADEFLRLAEKWLAEVPGDLAGEILAGERERKMLSGGFLEKVNSGREGKLKLSDEPGPAGGGMTVRAGRFEFDFSWKGRLDDMTGSLAPEIAGILFGEGDGPEA